MNRRVLLRGAAHGAVAAGLGWPLGRAFQAGAQPAPAREPIDLGGGFHVLPAGATNVLAVVDGAGVALVDGGAAAESAALLQRIGALAQGAKVHTLFNTHWHPEQTGLNEPLGKAGAKIVAQENTKLWLTTDVTWPWDERTVPPLPGEALPNDTFYTTTELKVAEKAVQCGHLRDCPHTDGDMYVFFPEQNVLAVGDAVWGAGWPSIDWWTGGWIGGLVGGLDMLFGVANDDTRIVPSRGPVLSRKDLQAQYNMYSLIWERLVKTLYSGGGTQEALAAEPTKEFDDTMGDSHDFVVRAFQSLWAYLSPDA